MQEADAEHRIRVLRARAEGTATPIPIGNTEKQPTTIAERFVAPGGSSQIGENEAAIVRRPTPPPPVKRRKASPVLTGADGHINLFADLENPKRQNKVEKNAEHEAEKKTKDEKLEAQYTMGLGKPAEELKPWYSTLDMVGEIKGRRKTDREIRKDDRSKDWRDPLLAIRRGVRGVKEAEEAREEWKRTKELEVGGPVGLAALNPGRSRSLSEIGHLRHSRKHRHESPTETTAHRHRRRYRISRSRSPRRGRSPQSDSMGKLREERDEREKTERRKAEVMLSKEKEYRLPGWEAAGGGRYSSQFGIGEVRRR